MSSSFIKKRLRNLIVFRYFLRRFFPSGLPPKLQLFVTYACNSKCKNCFIWKKYIDEPSGLKNEIKTEDLEILFKDYNNELKWLAISGGEPTLRNDLPQIVKLAKKYNPDLQFVTMNTNGLLPTDIINKVKSIAQVEPDVKIVLSLDGDEETHDDVRGVNGNHKRITQIHNELKESGIDLEIEYTIHADNASTTADYMKNDNFGKITNVFSFSLFSDKYYSNPITAEKKNEAYQKISKALKEVYKQYKPKKIEFWLEKIFLKLADSYIKTGQTPIPCAAGTNVLTIDAFGNVSTCFLMNPVGNIKKQSIREIVKSEKWISDVKKAKSGTCPKCWTNCYALVSEMTYPEKAIIKYIRTKTG